MSPRFARLIIAAAVVLLVAALTAPPFNAEENEKGSALVVEGWEVVGNKVLVKVSNLGGPKASGVVEVRAMTLGLPMKRAVSVSVPGGTSQWASVPFVAPVDGVIVVGIVDGGDPIQ
jgi:hypothetical protein